MMRNLKCVATVFLTALVCLVAAYRLTLQYWIQRTAVPVNQSQPPETNVMWTGVVLATNGLEFKLENLFDFGKRGASQVIFCEKTRQLFISFGGAKDDSFSQWDLDTGKCVHTWHAGKNFNQWPEAVSPDGKFLIVTQTGSGGVWKTLIVNVETRTVVAELGDLGAIYECRFSPDGTKTWLLTGRHWGKPIALRMDGSPVESFSAADFPETRDPRLWDVPTSKDTVANNSYGLYFRDTSDKTNLLTKDWWWDNYWITKDGRIIVASDWHDEIVIWDAKTAKEIIRQKITNHHNGGGWIIYDRLKDRFLIADPSYQGTTFLRALVIMKKPPEVNDIKAASHVAQFASIYPGTTNSVEGTNSEEKIPEGYYGPMGVQPVLHIYAELTGADLKLPDGIFTNDVLINPGRYPAMTRAEAIAFLEKLLREQAGIIAVHKDAKHIEIERQETPEKKR